MMLEPSRMVPPTNGVSMSSAGDSPVRTSATPASGLESSANAADCSLNSCEWFARWDRESSSWKTRQRCLIEGWGQFSESWPRAGSMRNGRCFPRALWVPHIHGPACSLWPTPTTKPDSRRHGYMLTGHSGTTLLDAALIRKYGESKRGPTTDCLNPLFLAWLMGFPIGWSDLPPSATPSCPKSPNTSDAA